MENKKYRALKLFKVLSNVTRYKIICMLSENSLTVKEITQKLKKSDSMISNHLKILKDLDLVYYHTSGHNVIYSLQKKEVKNIINYVENLFERN